VDAAWSACLNLCTSSSSSSPVPPPWDTSLELELGASTLPLVSSSLGVELACELGMPLLLLLSPEAGLRELGCGAGLSREVSAALAAAAARVAAGVVPEAADTERPPTVLGVLQAAGEEATLSSSSGTDVRTCSPAWLSIMMGARCVGAPPPPLEPAGAPVADTSAAVAEACMTREGGTVLATALGAPCNFVTV
jgi:hypothetical protein